MMEEFDGLLFLPLSEWCVPARDQEEGNVGTFTRRGIRSDCKKNDFYVIPRPDRKREDGIPTH